jgi:hypothetical protein
MNSYSVLTERGVIKSTSAQQSRYYQKESHKTSASLRKSKVLKEIQVRCDVFFEIVD